MSESPVLEFPAMLYGTAGEIRRKLKAQGKTWVREYLKTGGFTPPRSMRPVLPGEVLEAHSGMVFSNGPCWRTHMFTAVLMSLDEGVPREERQRMEDVFESFCLSTPWGAISYGAPPPPPRSAERLAKRLAALLRFWDVLQDPRYAFFPWREFTLEELVEHIYGLTMEAWCPGGTASVREHLTLTVERLARATQEECIKAVLRVIPELLKRNTHIKHRETLSNPNLQRERLAALRPEDFEDVSCADRYSVTGALYEWDRALGREQTPPPGGAGES